MKKYLAKHALIRPLLRFKPERNFDNAVVIPACAESELLGATLDSLQSNQLEQTIIVVNVNQPPDAPEHIVEDNRRTLDYLEKHPLSGKNLFFQDLSNPDKTLEGGVGMARKCGIDSVLEFLKSKDSLIFSLDADTLVEGNYLASAQQAFKLHPDAGGAIFAFEHQRGANREVDQAIKRYENFLNDYVAQLKSTGSPYAYHAIGSAMVFKASSYVRAGGMRIRSGGEDFYFLQALRKTAPIVEINTAKIHPASRLSQRVPFGTGPRLRRIIDGENPQIYPSEAFEQLKIVIRTVTLCKCFDDLCETLESALAPESWEFFKSRNFDSQWKKIMANTPDSTSSRQWAFHIWFDAFKTLKFIRSFL